MEYTLGEVILMATTYSPEYFLECRGQLLQIRDYQALYSLIGMKFGGDGVNNFNLPNLLGSEPHPELKYCICVMGVYPGRD